MRSTHSYLHRKVAYKALLSVFLIVIFIVCTAQAQDKFIRPITFLEGLPTQTIYDIHQGPKGYIYLGTDIGVFRYNGQTFMKIPTPESWDNNFDNLLHDEEGKLWVKNFANQIFKEENGVLKVIPSIQRIIQPLGGLKGFTVLNDNLYATLENTFLQIALDSFLPSYIWKSADEKDGFFSLQKFNNQLFFNGSQSIYDEKGNTLIESQTNTRILEFIFFQNNFYGLNRSLAGEIINLSTKQTIDQSNLPKGTYLYFFKTAGKDLFLCTSKGLFTIDIQKNKVSNALLKAKRISDVIEDREGNLWISSLDDGLFFVSQAPLFTTELKNFGSPQRTNILSLAQTDDRHLLAGDNKGQIFRINKSGTITKKYQSELENEVEFIHFDKEKQHVYYTQGHFEYPSGQKKQEVYFSKKLTPDDKGNFLVATSNGSGLLAQNFKNKPSIDFKGEFEITNFSILEAPFLVLFEKRTKTAFFSKTYQKYYLGTSEGLKVIDKNGTISTIQIQDGEPLIVNSITEDDQGTLWIGTQQKGLISLKGDRIQEIIPILDDNIIVPVKKLFFENERIFLIGGNQLYEYRIQSQKLLILSISSIFKGINLNDLMMWNNQLWLASSEGLLWTDLTQENRVQKPLIYLRGISLNDKPISLASDLPYGIQNLEFQFDVLHFSSMGSYNLQFRTNSNQDWQTLGKSQSAIVFAGLNSGKHLLEVRAVSGDKVSENLSIPFSVSTPFWKTWWFILVGLGCLGISIFWYLHNYRKKVTEKEAFTSKLLQSQLTALRSQMNPHFLFNVVNAVQGLIFANKKEDASHYLGQFSDLMRKVLQQSDKQFVRLEEEIHLIDLYISLEKRRFEEEFEYILDVDHQLEKHSIQIPSLIIQPFVENAVKHGLLHQTGNKKLNIRFELDSQKNRVIVTIEDNGIGRGAAQVINAKRANHQAFATKAINNRMDLLNQSFKEPISYEVQDLINEAGIGTGTLITISLPFTYDYNHTSR